MGKHAIFLLPQQGVFIFGQLPQLPHLPPFSFVSRPPAACRIAWGEAGPWAWRADWPTVGSGTTGCQIPAGGGLAANRARAQRYFQFKFRFQHMRVCIAGRDNRLAFHAPYNRHIAGTVRRIPANGTRNHAPF